MATDQESSIKLISDGVDFAPTNQRTTTSSANELPVVVAARKLKQQKRNKIVKLSLMVVGTLSMIVSVIAIVTLVSQETVQADTPTDKESLNNVQSAERQSRMSEHETEAQREAEAETSFDLSSMPWLGELGKSSARIGMQLYDQERKKSEGNLLFSPFSIQTALSMVTLGSKGSSLDQLMSFVSDTTTVKDQLALANKVVQMKQMFGQALPNFHTNNNFSIELANSIFVQEEYPILDGMMSDLSKYFESKVSFTDYKQPEKAADLINSWIEENTKEKIHDLISPSTVTQDTKVVLANALYFKGLWSNFFDKEETQKMPFHVTNEKSVEADFMHLNIALPLGTFKEQTVVGLPYAGDRFVMYLFLPHQLREKGLFFDEKSEDKEDKIVEKPLSALEEIMVREPEALTEALHLDKFDERKVDLLLPRFKLEESMALKENLQKLGVTAPFSVSEADLSGMTGKRDLYLTDAIHKAFLEVNEEGSEGAAATAIVAASRMLAPPPPDVHFDRPFVFFIKDSLTGLILFQGRVVDPTA